MKFDANTAYRLCLGRNIGTLGKVTDLQVNAFLADVVSANFPAFSVSFGLGYWQGKPEESVYLDIVSEDSPATLEALSRIAAEYNTRFSQECVLVTRQTIGVNFASLRLADAKTA